MTSKTWTAALAAALLVGGAGAASAATEAPDERASARAASAQADVGITATDAPSKIRVGAAAMTIPVTVITDEPMDDLDAGVFSSGDDLVAYGYTRAAEAGRPRVFKPQVELYAEDLTGWGAHEWDFFGYRVDDDVAAVGVAPTDVRAHSMLGLAVARSGATVTVRGSARAYHSVQDRYVPWSGRPVSVQRWTGSAWVQVTGATTDARGNLSATVPVPAGSQLRLVVKDVGSIWGAVSATATA
ncbi:hypothetical protein [uncultured Pseudokineococcus sp.]|uniref:hypothetical protein n=1 Tax=uncultured Pseudokineococcus sp. TaxID=1642928 RepID=UPI0026230298|nr:hypothetical protein [uncultured Pseudokineococcus sp.]